MPTVKKLFLVLVYLMAIHAHGAFSAGMLNCPSTHKDPIVIFIEPTKDKIRLLQEKYGDNYNDVVSDAIFYRSEYEGSLTAKNFPFCRSKRLEHVFVMQGKKVRSIKECDSWCMIYWDGKNDPVWNPENLLSLVSLIKQPYLVLKPGSSGNDFRFARDGSVYFKDKLIHKFESPDVSLELHISQPSPVRGYAHAIFWDTDKGGFGWVIVDSRSAKVVARTSMASANKIFTQLYGEEIRWSPAERYAIVPERGEVQRRVSVIDLDSGDVFSMDIGSLVQNKCQFQFIDQGNGRWLNDETYLFRVGFENMPVEWRESGIVCNDNKHYPDYELEVNARTRRISKAKMSPAGSDSSE